MMNVVHIRRLTLIVISASLIALAFWLSGTEDIVHVLARFPLWATVCMVVLLMANMYLVSFRFWTVLRHFEIEVPWKDALRANVAGNVAGLVVMPLFGQVAGRQSMLQKIGVAPVVNTSIAAYERAMLAMLSGVLGSFGGLYLLGEHVVAGFLREMPLVEIGITAAGGLGLSLYLGRSRFEKHLFSQVFRKQNFYRIAKIAALTVGGQALMLGCFVVAMYAVSSQIPAVSMFAAATVISLAATIPITVGGWGVRELASVYVLGTLGVPAADAMTISVMVGLCSMLPILALAPLCLKIPDHA